jgi:hypothetical protein
VSENSQGGELNGAEPMLRANSSSVLRSSCDGSDNVEGPGAERRPPPAFLVIIAIAALKGRDSSLHHSHHTARKVVTA